MAGFGTASLPLQIPACEKGIGHLIVAPDSPQLIEGVKTQPFPIWPDDRGYFLEVLRLGQGIAGTFDPSTTQVSAALSYPDTIKAFHYHIEQTDFWVIAQGMLQVALLDLRRESSTFGVKNTLCLGTLRPWQLLIPPGVAHGYKVIGAQAALLVYVTNRTYNKEDEGRIPYNDPQIQYDWEIQHK